MNFYYKQDEINADEKNQKISLIVDNIITIYFELVYFFNLV